jgi:putative membrane protein
MWWSDMWWSDHWPFPFMFPFMGIVFMLVCMAMMFFMMRHRGHGRDGDALEILRARFARGEINQAEYEERRRLLQA